MTAFWNPKYHELGVHHEIYNPAPDWRDPPKHPLEVTVDYCQEQNCVGSALNTLSVAASAIAVACASSIIGNAGCSEVAGGISFVSSVVGTAVIADKVIQNEATTADLTMSLGTTVIGGFPVVGQSSKAVGFGAALVQLVWDKYNEENDYGSGYSQ